MHEFTWSGRAPGRHRTWVCAAAALLSLTTSPCRAADDGWIATAALMPVRPDIADEVPAGATPWLPTPEQLEARRAVVGSVAISVEEIFDEADPREDGLLYRLANDLKIRTREGTIREALLLQPGDAFSAQKAEESARLLRERDYLADAEVVPARYDSETNTVDMRVHVRDVWTLEPGIGIGRKGGTNKARLRIADENLFGFGQKVALGYSSDVDRSGVNLQFIDPNLFHSWWSLDTAYADNSDGSNVYVDIGRPFFSLDSRWSAGLSANTRSEITPLYTLGEKVSEFASQYDDISVQGGISKGLVDGWTTRWLAGYRYDRARFTPVPDSEFATADIPDDRTLSYPWVGIEMIEDQFTTTRNRDQIGRIEDLFLGRRFHATLGFASPALGSDRNAGIFSVGGGMSYAVGALGEMDLAANWEGRLESGGLVDAVAELSTRYYHRFDEKNTLMTFVGAAHADDLTEDRQLQLGGDNGLRGYPLRYQTGDTRLQAIVEERYYTDWYPFRLFRVGAAAFADVGRMWGGDPAVTGSQEWLADVGVGLRLGNARSGSGGSVLHIDVAFPLNGAQDIGSMQLLLEGRKSF